MRFRNACTSSALTRRTSMNRLTNIFYTSIFFAALTFLLLSGCATSDIIAAGGDYKQIKNIIEYCEQCLVKDDCKNRVTCENDTSKELLEYVMSDAISRGRLDTVQYFIETLNFNVNTPMGRYQETPLHVASYYRSKQHHEIARYLVSKGANVNSICTSHDRTPLLTSIWKHNNVNVRFLLSQKADPSIPSDRGLDACLFAHRWSNWDIIPDLPGCCDRFLNNSRLNETIRTPELVQACQNRDVSSVSSPSAK